MKIVFIDTNVFEKMGFNFDLQNPVIYTFIKKIQNNIFSYYSLSIIDNEIIDHIKKRGEEKKSLLKQNKWIKNYVTDEDIEKNCNKDYYDYLDFKEKANVIKCGIENINPEIIFERYFKNELPFERKKDKKNEFPDAFISEFINRQAEDKNNEIYFVSNDTGLINSLSNQILHFSDLESFLSKFCDIDSKLYHKFDLLINSYKKEIEENLYSFSNLRTCDLENEEIDMNNISIGEIKDFDVIDVDENIYTIVCSTNYIKLEGEFSCFDYMNSYMPNDCDFYVVEEYINTNQIKIEDYEFILKILVKEDDNFEFKFLNSYDIEISFNDFIIE